MAKQTCTLSPSQERALEKLALALSPDRRSEFMAKVKSHLVGTPSNDALLASMNLALDAECAKHPDAILAEKPKQRIERRPWHMTGSMRQT
jgi:hypothetical protein